MITRYLAPLTLLAGALAATPLAAAPNPPSPSPSPGFADPVLGRWNVTVVAQDGTRYPSWFDIRLRTESELMASFVGRFGSTRHASSVTFNDGRLSLGVPRQYEKPAPELRFDGALVDGQLAGVIAGDNGATESWTARRAPALPARLPMRWSRPVAWFDGRSLAQWRGPSGAPPPCWQIRDGVLHNAAGCANLLSRERLGDLKLHLEFKNVAGGNSGIYLRGRYEIQISVHIASLDPLRMGAVYGHLRPSTLAARAAGQWQTLDVTLIGRVVSVVLNGTTVIDAQEIPGITGGALDSDEDAPGPLMLQGDHSAIEIRRLTVAQPLPPSHASTTPPSGSTRRFSSGQNPR